MTTPVDLYASPTSYHLTELGIDIPPGLLKTGSSITYNAFIERANITTLRSTHYAVGPISFYNNSYLVNTSQWNHFGGDAMSDQVTYDNNRVFYKKVGFFGDVNYLADYVDFIGTRYSDSIATRYSPGSGDTLTSGRNLSTNQQPLSLTEGFIFMPTISFGLAGLNDYVLWNLSRLEVNI